ncbi:hypothetical protein ACOJBO_08300 [Rhizobium beringeri]
MRPLIPAETVTATVLQFRERSETAAHSMAQKAGDHQSIQHQAGRATKETDDMANLKVMTTSFAEMDAEMEVIKKHLPFDQQPQIEKLHGKLKQTQQEMLATQEASRVATRVWSRAKPCAAHQARVPPVRSRRARRGDPI